MESLQLSAQGNIQAFWQGMEHLSNLRQQLEHAIVRGNEMVQPVRPLWTLSMPIFTGPSQGTLIAQRFQDEENALARPHEDTSQDALLAQRLQEEENAQAQLYAHMPRPTVASQNQGATPVDNQLIPCCQSVACRRCAQRPRASGGKCPVCLGRITSAETRQLSDISTMMEMPTLELPFAQHERECKICMSEAIDTCFRPCGHSVACQGCAEELRARNGHCPICRAKIIALETGSFNATFGAVESKGAESSASRQVQCVTSSPHRLSSLANRIRLTRQALRNPWPRIRISG